MTKEQLRQGEKIDRNLLHLKTMKEALTARRGGDNLVIRLGSAALSCEDMDLPGMDFKQQDLIQKIISAIDESTEMLQKEFDKL